MDPTANSVLASAARQRAPFRLKNRDPRDEKWAEFHMHPDTRRALSTLYGVPGPGPAHLFDYPVRADKSMPVGEVKLVCETDFEAGVRHLTDAGHTINVMKPQPVMWVPPPVPAPPPTLRVLIKHWWK